MKNGEEPLSWKSKTAFFTFLLLFFLMLFLQHGSLSLSGNFGGFSSWF